MRSNSAPITYYVVKPRGQTARVFASLAQASAAVTGLAPTPVDLSAITGARRRGLTASELSEVRELCRAHGLRHQPSLAGPPADAARPELLAPRLTERV